MNPRRRRRLRNQRTLRKLARDLAIEKKHAAERSQKAQAAKKAERVRQDAACRALEKEHPGTQVIPAYFFESSRRAPEQSGSRRR